MGQNQEFENGLLKITGINFMTSIMIGGHFHWTQAVAVMETHIKYFVKISIGFLKIKTLLKY